MKASNRVIVNTGIQYLRAFISIIITLYTSRIVLNSLGVNDFGIYSLVGGVIHMLSFIQINLSKTNMRFLSYYRGRANIEKIKDIFNNSITTQILIGGVLCVVLLLITGPVFNKFLNIAPERIPEAKVVYYLMICSLFFNFMSVPFQANLLSHENIVFSSIVQIVDAIIKIPVALSLLWVPFNGLEWYAFCIMSLTVLNFSAYYFYCKKKYIECKKYNPFKFDIKLFKEMFSFMGWNVYGTMCIVARNQGIAILLNRFYTTAINAAYGIAFQVLTQISFLSTSLTNAINPQIMKAEGGGNRGKMIRLTEISCKFSFILMAIICIPAVIYMPTILKIWLKNVPDYTVMFCRYVLIASQIDLLSSNMASISHAIGKVKRYILTQQTLKVLTLPAAYIALKLGYNAEMVMIVFLSFEIICVVSRVIFLHISVSLSIINYIRNVLLGCIPPIIINVLGCYALSNVFEGYYMLITFFISLLIIITTTYLFGLRKDEKQIVEQILIKKFKLSKSQK